MSIASAAGLPLQIFLLLRERLWQQPRSEGSCPADVLSARHIQIERKVITGIYFKLTEQGVVFWAVGGM